MAKKKNEVIEEAVVEEAVVEEIAEEIAKEEPVAEQDKSEQFVYAQLKAINKMSNPAKAKRLAERVLRNRKR